MSNTNEARGIQINMTLQRRALLGASLSLPFVSAAMAQPAEPIRFGAILPLTGPGGLIGTQ